MHNVIFDHIKHEYSIGDKILISVTQMMQKVGATQPVPENIKHINVAREIGIANHAALADYINNPFYDETNDFVEFFDKFLSNNAMGKSLFSAELIIFDEKLGIAGTVDAFHQDELGKVFIIDHKFTSTHKKQHMWQVAIYALLCGKDFDSADCYIINYKLKRVEKATEEDFRYAKEIITAYVENTEFEPLALIPEDLEEMYTYVVQQMDEMNEQKLYLEYLIAESIGKKAAKGSLISVTYKKPSVQIRLIADKVSELLNEHAADRIVEFYKETKVKDSYSFKINK